MAGISLVGVPALADAGVSVELETTIVGGSVYPPIYSGVTYNNPISSVIPQSSSPYIPVPQQPIVNPPIESQKTEPKDTANPELVKPDIVKPEIVADMLWVWFIIVPSAIVILAFLLYKKYRRNNL